MKTHIDNLEKIIIDRCYVKYMEGMTQEQLLNLGYKVALSSEGKREIRDLMQRYADERVGEFVEYLFKDRNGKYLTSDIVNWKAIILRCKYQFINQNTKSSNEDKERDSEQTTV